MVCGLSSTLRSGPFPMGQTTEDTIDTDCLQQRCAGIGHRSVEIDCNKSTHPLSTEIDRLVAERSEWRAQKLWKEADRLKALLSGEPYCVELFDRCDGHTVWKKLDERKRPVERRVVWSRADAPSSVAGHNTTVDKSVHTPLVIATVDSPHYRLRLGDTLDHISNINSNHHEDAANFRVKSIDMLDLKEHPSVGTKRIIYEGWRQILLPKLLQIFNQSDHTQSECAQHDEEFECCARDGFVLVAEDDMRLPDGIGPDLIRCVCIQAFEADPDIHILSLGHGWSPAKPSQRQRRRQRRQKSDYSASVQDSCSNATLPRCSRPSLFNHLQSGGGVHGATLMAIRFPEGIQSLLDAMNGVTQAGKRTHFDQFLFHSTLHNVGLALLDPSLCGWAEVSETLTSAGPGQRNGGGRLEHLPKIDGKTNDFSCFELVRRKRLEDES